MSSESVVIIIAFLIVSCGCLICWFECCSDIICNDDTIHIEPETDNPVIDNPIIEL